MFGLIRLWLAAKVFGYAYFLYLVMLYFSLGYVYFCPVMLKNVQKIGKKRPVMFIFKRFELLLMFKKWNRLLPKNDIFEILDVSSDDKKEPPELELLRELMVWSSLSFLAFHPC